MGNKRIYLGREVGKYAAIAGGAIVTITSLFFVLMVLGFEITGSDDFCLGTPEDPCVSYGKICNLGPDNYDIYNPEEIKIDFSPTIKDYWMFFKDGRIKKEFLIPQGIDHSTAGWRYENFTNATKPRSDRVYVHRFARYTCQDYMLVGLKESPDDVIKWGFGVGREYLDPFWYGENESAATTSVSGNLSVELESKINITTNLTGATRTCVDIDHPEYGDEYACGSPNANFLFNISYFRKTELNDSSTSKNISWVNGGNHTVYIRGHQYDEIDNVSINITGYETNNTYPTNVRIYINGSLSNVIPLTSLNNSLTTLSDDSTIKNITFESPLSIQYLKIFGSASVSSAYFNLSGFGDYSHGTSLGSDFSVGSYSIGITQNGTYFWVVSDGDNKVYEYYMNGTSTGFNFSTPTGRPYGITQNGTYFWIVNGYDNAVPFVSKYWMNGTDTGETFNVGCARPSGITQNNEYIWVACYNPNSIRKFSMEGNVISTFNYNYGTPYGMTNDGVHIWISDHLNSKVYKYSMSGTDTGVSFSTVGTGSGITQDGEFFWSLPWSATPTTQKYSMGYVVNASLEVGAVDGVKEWNYTGLFNGTARLDNFNSSINTALETCSIDESGYCDIPLYFVSDYYGIIQISNIEINYTQNPNPVILDKNLISSFLGNSSGYVDIPIKFQSSQNGTLKISDIKYDYRGGNDTIEILVWEKNVSLTETNFNNSLTTENLTFTGNENITRYLEIRKDLIVTSAYFNLSGYSNYEGEPVESFSTSGRPSGITQNGTYIWVTDYIDDKTYRYYMNGTLIDSFSTTSLPYGITNNNTYFWMADYGDHEIHKYWMNGTNTGDSFAFVGGFPHGITQNGTYFWITDYSNGELMKYWMNGTEIEKVMNTVSAPYGVTQDGTYFWIVPNAGTNVRKYWMNGTDMGDGFAITQYSGGITNDGTYFWIANDGNNLVYKYWMERHLTNPFIEIGTPDGIHEWNYSGIFNETFSPNKTIDLSSAINSALNSGACDCTGCVLDGDNCSIPLLFHSDTAGILEYSDINITGVYDNKSNNDTLDLFVYYSSFIKELPYTWANKIFFMPKTNSSKNVTAYKQTSTIPAYNITTTNYGGDMNMSMKVNESFSCMNITWNTNSTKPTGNKINTTWQVLGTNLEYLNNTRIWLWADFDQCNASNQKIFQPLLQVEGYCVDCIWF